MGHDPSKVLLGSSPSSEREVSCEPADPTSFPAGLAVRRATGGGLQLNDDAVAAFVGISAGASLSDTKKTAVFRSGLRVPLKLKNEAVLASKKIGDITFTSKLLGVEGNSITITLADTESDGEAVASVTDNEIIISIESTVTLAETIAAAIDDSEEVSALISYAIDSGDEDAPQTSAVEQALLGGVDGTVAVIGAVVKIDDTTGEASSDGDDTGAIYSSEALTGVYPDGTTTQVALVDMQGGL